MSSFEVIVLPGGYRLRITSDSTSTGYYFQKGNPGEPSGGLVGISTNAEVNVGPFNVDKQFQIVSETGRITYEVLFEYVQDEVNTLESLTDVVFTDLLEGDTLVYNGTNWQNEFGVPGSGATELDELTDVTIGTTANRQALVFNSGTSVFENRLLVEADISDLQSYLVDITNEELDDLNDVNIVLPENGQALVYNTGVWSNEDVFSGDYGDLTNLPTLGTMAAEAADDYTPTASLSAVALSNDYGDLDNLPTISGTNTGDQNIFQTIAVSGQSDVVADSTTDTLTLAAGSGITITTDATTDTITLTSSVTQYTDEMAQDAVGGALVDSSRIDFTYNDGANTITADIVTGSITSTYVDSTVTTNAFKTISVSGQSDVVADSAADTLTLVAGTNITITTDAGTDTITINSSGSGGGLTRGQAFTLCNGGFTN